MNGSSASRQAAEFRVMAEATSQIVGTTWPDVSNDDLNRRWTGYTGLSLAEFVGDGRIRPFHPDERQRAWDAWTAATAPVGAGDLDWRPPRRDGVHRWRPRGGACWSPQDRPVLT